MAASCTHRHRLGGTGLALDAVVRQGIRRLLPRRLEEIGPAD